MNQNDALWMNFESDALDAAADAWEERQAILKELAEAEAESVDWEAVKAEQDKITEADLAALAQERELEQEFHDGWEWDYMVD